MGGGSLHRYQIFKQNWNISISSSTIEFWLIPRVPLGGWGMGGRGWGMVRGCPPHTCTCTHMHAHAHMCARVLHHREFPGIPQKSNGSSHLHEIIMFTTHACVCMCMRACVCMCTCVGAPPNHPPPPYTQPPPLTTPHPPTPHPHSCREPKTPKFNKSWTNQDNSILFEDSLPLNIPELI